MFGLPLCSGIAFVLIQLDGGLVMCVCVWVCATSGLSGGCRRARKRVLNFTRFDDSHVDVLQHVSKGLSLCSVGCVDDIHVSRALLKVFLLLLCNKTKFEVQTTQIHFNILFEKSTQIAYIVGELWVVY